ncbi:shikimate dehydrogenase [Alphaproteobacteria bacterium]|nr:shikimate dehydrogenase [Alphaproteobacteria bacterium]
MKNNMVTGIIGSPIKHSLSPIIHRYWMDMHNIVSSYDIYEPKKHELSSFLKGMSRNNIEGINVTIPFKRDVMKHLDTISEEALALGAVNTIKLEDNKLFGYNTDTHGFMQHLKTSAPEWKEKKGGTVILGAGGASRAVIWSLLKENKRDIRIINRNENRALTLIADMKKFFPAANITFFNDPIKALINSTLFINCSSLGMKGQKELELDLVTMNKESIVYDIVYSPLKTKLLHRAKELGFKTIDGLGMLLNQAAPAFKMWYHKEVIVTEDLRNKVIEHLERS